ncbi:MAG: hypothetical protein IKM76_07475 [Prevotella sp.]|nr:hypothetical protein [Prevotella sp.]
MINILPELIYKERQRLSDFDIDNEGTVDNVFYTLTAAGARVCRQG